MPDSYELTTEFTSRLKDYLSSDNFGDVNDVSASSYWKYHLDHMDVSFDGNIVSLDSKSGNYIPLQGKDFSSLIPIPDFAVRLKRSLQAFKKGYSLFTYAQAFDLVMNHSPIADVYLNSSRINFQKLKDKPGIIKSVKDIQENFFGNHKYKIVPQRTKNVHIIRAYYYFNIIWGFVDFPQAPTIMEIGAGNGNLASILYNKLDNATMIIVDLPKTICLSSIFLSDLFPEAKVCLPNEFNENTNVKDYDFVFITPTQTQFLKDNSVDLAANTASFHEMTHEQIKEYIDLIQRVGKPDSHFFVTNRVEKIPSVSDTGDAEFLKKEAIEPVNRFTDYPWNPNNEPIVFEVCRLVRLVGLDNYFIRLEKIKK